MLTGSAFTVSGITGAGIQGLLIGKIAERYGDFGTIVRGVWFGVAGNLLIASVPWLSGVFASIVVISAAGALIQPMTFSLLSTTSPLPHGTTMGLQQTFRQAGMMLGPLWAGWTYSLHPALPFLSSAALFALLLGYLLLVEARRLPRKTAQSA